MRSCAGACDPNLDVFHTSIFCSDVWDSLRVVLRLDELQDEWVLTTCLLEILCRQNWVKVLDCWNAMTCWHALRFFCGILDSRLMVLGNWLWILDWLLFDWFLLNWLWFNWLWSWGFDVLFLWYRLGFFDRFFLLGSLLSLLGLSDWLLLSYCFLFLNFRCFDFCLSHWSFCFGDRGWFYFFSSLNLRFLFLNILGVLVFRLFNILLFWFLFAIWLIIGLLVSGSVVVSWTIVLFSLIVIEIWPSFWKEVLVFHVLLGSA